MHERQTTSFGAPYRSAIWNATPNAYLLISPNFEIVEANDAYARATLIRPDDVRGRHLFDVFPDNPATPGARSVAHLTESLETVLRERRPHVMQVQRYDIRDEAGRFLERHWEPGNYPVFDESTGELAYILHHVVDVTDRVKQALAHRQHAEEAKRFQQFVDHSPLLAWIKDEQGRNLFLNKAYEKHLGLQPEDWRGKIDAEIWPAATAEQFRQNDIAVLKDGQPLLLVEETLEPDGSRRHWLSCKFPFWDASGSPLVGGIALDITQQKRHEENLRLVMRELNHRSKNLLALVLAVARQMATVTPEDFVGRFSDRIFALTASQDLLVKNEGKGVDVEGLVLSQLAPFKDLIGARIKVHGPSLILSASAAQTIGMAMYELATNAGKYGALSSSTGCVEIEWTVTRNAGNREMFLMSWDESGGPPVTPPSKPGFGSTVLTRLAEHALSAKAELEYPVTGLRWRLECTTVDVLKQKRAS